MTTSSSNFIINDAGNDCYEKSKKDSKLSFWVGPLFLAFIIVCFAMASGGLKLRFFLIIIWPTILIGLAFLYTPLIKRGKYFGHTIKRISFSEENVSIETYGWFRYKSISMSAPLADVQVKSWAYPMFYAGKKVFLVILKNSEANTFYLVEEFFDNSDEILKLLNSTLVL